MNPLEDALQSLRRLPCVPSRVSIDCTRGLRIHEMCQVDLPILKCLTSPGPQWSDTITTLDLPCIRDLPQQIEQLKMASWPQLKSLYFFGGPGSTYFGSVAEFGEVLTQSLIDALPKMPKATTIGICLLGPEACKFSGISLTLSVYGSFRPRLPFVPRGNNGFARFQWLSIPGRLAEKLQDVVWSQHGRELDVFCTPKEKLVSGDGQLLGSEAVHNIGSDGGQDDDHDDDGSSETELSLSSELHQCTQWNRQKNRWDLFAGKELGWGREYRWVLVEDSKEPGTVKS